MSNSTITAVATAAGMGAIGIVRVSGAESIELVNKVFKGKNLECAKPNTLHYGHIVDVDDQFIDEVMVAIYHAPHSYTGENSVEIMGHGSPYILEQILLRVISAGALLAEPGAFTQRAFLNGKMDLTQAEAVGDLIASTSSAQHRTALHTLRGGLAGDLQTLREELIHFVALIELELDFGEEDVAFADKGTLEKLIKEALSSVQKLIASFALGNAIKHGINVAIVGAPNAGKSTLLNALLQEERAIVSDIAGTTRDTVEEVLHIDGIAYRFVDTAGIRAETKDEIERIGIERSRAAIARAAVVLYMVDTKDSDLQQHLTDAVATLAGTNVPRLLVFNKWDHGANPKNTEIFSFETLEVWPAAYISARSHDGLQQIFDFLSAQLPKISATTDTIVTNARHHTELLAIEQALQTVKQGLETNLSGDFLAIDLRNALLHIGNLTGQVQHDRDVLGKIFGSFCIGK